MARDRKRPGLPGFGSSVLGGFSGAQNSPDEGVQTLYISPALIDPHPTPPRTVYTSAMIEDRAKDLKENGQRDPIHVIPNPDAEGRYIICDGWTRVLACFEHNALPSLRADVHHELNVDEAAWFGFKQNEGREQETDLDRAFFFESQIKKGMTARDIAEQSGLKESAISLYRNFTKLPQEVIAVIQSNATKFGSFSATQLKSVYEKLGSSEAVNFANRIVQADLTTRQIKVEVDALVRERAQKTPDQTASRNDFPGGWLKQTKDGFSMKIKIPEVEQQEAFAKELKDLLAKYSPSTSHEDQR